MPEEKGVNKGAGGKSRKPKPSLAVSQAYLFVIGIDDYQYTTKLNNAVRDAQAVRDLLLERYNFSQERLYELYNQDATEDNIFAVFEKLHKAVRNTDSLLIYFSGHGQYQKIIDEGYWVPVDGREDRNSTLMPFGMIRKYINAIPSRHTLVLADSCFSGSAVTYKSLSRAAEESYRLTSRWILTAGRNEVVADGPPGTHSPFAQSLLTQLEVNQKPWLNISSLGAHVREVVSTNSTQIPSIGPIVDTGHQGGEFMFILKGKEDLLPVNQDLDSEVQGASRSLESRDPQTETPEPEAGNRSPAPPQLSLDSLANIKKAVKLKLANDDFAGAFDILNEIIKEDSRHELLLIQLQGQYNGAKRDFGKGILRDDHYKLTMNKVRNSLSEMMKDLEEEDVNFSA